VAPGSPTRGPRKPCVSSRLIRSHTETTPHTHLPVGEQRRRGVVRCSRIQCVALRRWLRSLCISAWPKGQSHGRLAHGRIRRRAIVSVRNNGRQPLMIGLNNVGRSSIALSLRFGRFQLRIASRMADADLSKPRTEINAVFPAGSSPHAFRIPSRDGHPALRRTNFIFRPVEALPRFWIWPSSSECQKDFNLPEQRALSTQYARC